MQRKLISLEQCGVKFDANNPRKFSGYASVFGGLDSYGDTIERGAYADTLENRERPVMMRWNHFGPVIGKWLQMYEDEKGLFVEGELTPNHSVASDVGASLLHGAVDGLSIGYMLPEDGYEERGNARVLKRIILREVSVVEEPADNDARISGVKASINGTTSLKDIENFLRDAVGFSKSDALALVARVRDLSLGDQVGDQSTSELKALLQRNIQLIKGGHHD